MRKCEAAAGKAGGAIAECGRAIQKCDAAVILRQMTIVLCDDAVDACGMMVGFRSRSSAVCRAPRLLFCVFP
jgi:hypothetical protein